MSDYEFITVEEPAPKVRRISLNRPERRNAINNAMRGELLDCLQRADGDDGVHVSIVRGAGSCFSSGYDLKSDLGSDQPYFTPQVGMQWARHASEGWMSVTRSYVLRCRISAGFPFTSPPATPWSCI